MLKSSYILLIGVNQLLANRLKSKTYAEKNYYRVAFVADAYW